MSLTNLNNQSQKPESDTGKPEAIRRSARIKERKSEGNVPGMDKSWSAALNRAQNSSRIQQSFLATARGDGKNWAGPRDIFKDPGLPKIALLVPKKEEPQDVDSDLDAGVLQGNENTATVDFQTDSEVLAGDLNLNLSVQSVQPHQGSELPSSSVNPNGVGSTPLVLSPEKEEAQDAERDSDTGDVNDGASVSLQIDSVFTVGDFHSVQPRQDNESWREMLNSRLNDDRNGTIPTLLGSACLCGLPAKVHELEKVVEEKNLQVGQLEKDLKEKNLEVDLLKKQIKNLQQQNALAGAKLLKVVVNQRKINDIQQKSPEVDHMDESPFVSSSSECSEDEAPSGVPSWTQAAVRTPARNSTQPIRAYSLRSKKEPEKPGDPTASSRESIVLASGSKRSEKTSCPSGVEVPGTSSADPQAPSLPTTSSCSNNSKTSFNEEQVSNDPGTIHEVDEHLLRMSQFGCICGLRFKRLKYLRAHMARQGRTKCFRCDHCPKVFAVMYNLNGHLRRDHKTQPKTGFGCRICGQVFKTNKLLYQHKTDDHRIFYKKRHDVSAPHGYASRVQDSPRGHFCNCGKSYASRGALRQHVMRQSLPVPFKCPDCVAQFSDCFKVKRHVRMCHGRPDYDVFGCYTCGATFPNRRKWILHKAVKNH